jgi:hypothetical protein
MPRTTKKKNKGGRPPKYKKENAEIAYKLCLLGLTDVELGEYFGVIEKTINNWKKSHPEFLQALKKGKVIADANVAERNYKLATGYQYDEVHTIKEQVYKDGKPVEGTEIVRTETIRKEIPANVTSGIFWLKNRRRKDWSDKQEVEHKGTVVHRHGISPELQELLDQAYKTNE